MDGHRHSLTSLAALLTRRTLAVLDGQGHDAINQAPEPLVTQLAALQLASARCGSFHPGRTKWQVYPFG